MLDTSKRTNRVTRDGLVFLEHTFTLPLDHGASSVGAPGRTIEVFAREVVEAEAENDDRPYLVWFQGGPGNAADRPGIPGGWLKRALEEFRVVLLDQRGTGRSSAITHHTLPAGNVEEQSDYLAHFRADSIVRDAELIRQALTGDRKWSVLGQSFGGFCALTYLSLAPEGLESVMITGGIPDIEADIRDIYRANYRRTIRRNEEFFTTYPMDRDRVLAIKNHLLDHEEYLPTGERLTAERFLSLGILLGTKSGFDQLHYLLEAAFSQADGKPRLTASFLTDAGAALSFAKRPLYAVLHEAIYADSNSTDWAAHEVRQEFPEFADASVTSRGESLLTGEMIFPWQFEQDPALQPLKDVAHHLAQRTDWPSLYAPGVLARNEVPAAAVIYTEDMFVPCEGSKRTAAGIAALVPIFTDQYQHDGIRQDGAALLDQLLTKVRS
ncbi:pimeloyl-ACP methyl ester carboxylesterase [Arthrobacter sp. 1088]|uniref:alpha/beta fold hydrolase n=1 Tax=Arthrobacter sp. 1088 TaxID=2817768 RepID=UPI002854B02D|nr:alpha/beta fold hydrolase [Arthrobacter sp. 1088]MDR6687715.1 pimeloyl-ACP methyl ester carboxylesterase [Arthrobacter sp. 1088]